MTEHEDIKPADRRVPFDHMKSSDQYLVIFDGGTHALFNGPTRLHPDSKGDAALRALIQQASTAFWDAYLKNDAAAKQWLTSDEWQKTLGNAGTFEQKHPATTQQTR